jgi:hypothetical protein
MDFMSRGQRPNQPSNQQAGSAPSSNTNQFSGASSSGTSKVKQGLGLLNLGSVVLVFSIAILILAVVGTMLLSGRGNVGQAKYVDQGKMQAVFLNGGQVYFGKINNINSNFLRLSDIYYLRVNQQVQPGQPESQAANDISLVKLGCELHGPTDEMVINGEQVIFWENLKSDGQVAKAVEEYKKQNPEGQKCEQPQQNQGNAQQQNNGGNNAPATPAPNTEGNPAQ